MNKPMVIENETVAVCDVDWTLIEACLPDTPGAIKMLDPRTDEDIYFVPYEEHILLVKQMKGRGRYIIVWSAAGFAWADAIVNVLGLRPYVDMTMTKPAVAIDDKPIEEWLTRCYLPKTTK